MLHLSPQVALIRSGLRAGHSIMSMLQQSSGASGSSWLLDLLRRRHEIPSTGHPSAPQRGPHTCHCSPFNILRRWYLLCDWVPLHHSASREWPTPLYGQYVYSSSLSCQSETRRNKFVLSI